MPTAIGDLFVIFLYFLRCTDLISHLNFCLSLSNDLPIMRLNPEPGVCINGKVPKANNYIYLDVEY